MRTGGGVRTLQGHTQAITQIDYSGDRVVSLAGDGIRVWDLKYDTKTIFLFPRIFFPVSFHFLIFYFFYILDQDWRMCP